MVFVKWVCFLLLILFAVVASLMKSSADFHIVIDHVERAVGGDKVLHFTAALLLGFCSVWCTPKVHRVWLGKRIGLPTLIIVILILMDEISQIWLPRREFSLLDLRADFVGLSLGILAYTLISVSRKNCIRLFLDR